MVKNWSIFLRERFDPLYYIVVTAVFIGAHYTLVVDQSGSEADWLDLATLFGSAGLFFLLLRLSDEIKDLDQDRQWHPDRPLPRGLITLKQAKIALPVLVIGKLLLFSLIEPLALAIFVPVLCYWFLMYQEFFVGSWLRDRLTLYAVTHTAVIVLLSLTIFSALSGMWFWQLPAEYFYFAFSSWMIFNIFEFGRKTRASAEDQDGLPSYSKNFGRLGAVCLSFGAALTGSFLLYLALDRFSIATIITLLALAFCGALYVYMDQTKWAKLYRLCTLFAIILLYSSVWF